MASTFIVVCLGFLGFALSLLECLGVGFGVGLDYDYCFGFVY